MLKIPPQADISIEIAPETAMGQTIIYTMALIRKAHKDIFEGLDETEIHDLIIDALMRTSLGRKGSPSKIIHDQLELASYLAKIVPFFAKKEQQRKLREIPSGLIPAEMEGMISDDKIPGDDGDCLHEETLELFRIDANGRK